MPHVEGHSRFGSGWGNTKPSAPPGQNPYGPHKGYGSSNTQSESASNTESQSSGGHPGGRKEESFSAPPDYDKGNKTIVKNNSNNNNSGNNDNKNNQQKVIDFISVNEETDTKFKSYTTINYANSKIQTVSQKINAILAADPTWTKMDAINYLDGKWTKMGESDNTPRWNNGKEKGLVVSDKIKGIKGGEDYNTWGGGLRRSSE